MRDAHLFSYCIVFRVLFFVVCKLIFFFQFISLHNTITLIRYDGGAAAISFSKSFTAVTASSYSTLAHFYLFIVFNFVNEMLPNAMRYTIAVFYIHDKLNDIRAIAR